MQFSREKATVSPEKFDYGELIGVRFKKGGRLGRFLCALPPHSAFKGNSSDKDRVLVRLVDEVDARPIKTRKISKIKTAPAV